MVKLHLGCGKINIPGFIHIDCQPFEHIDHVCSIDSLSFLPNDSIDLIYSCHVLEHFKIRMLHSVLCEWNRVLKKDGVCRISVPDFSALSNIYDKYKNLKLIIGALFGRQDYLYNIHYNVFDEETLKSYLLNSGFSHVRKYDWRETEHSHIDDYSQAYIPHMDKDNGIMISLNVEAIK